MNWKRNAHWKYIRLLVDGHGKTFARIRRSKPHEYVIEFVGLYGNFHEAYQTHPPYAVQGELKVAKAVGMFIAKTL